MTRYILQLSDYPDFFYLLKFDFVFYNKILWVNCIYIKKTTYIHTVYNIGHWVNIMYRYIVYLYYTINSIYI